MPTITKLTNHRLKVEAVVRRMERRWAFAARCNVTGNEVWVEFDEDTKDMMVKDMTGGIVIPDGSRPIEGFEPA
jgi:hypothetical protein